VGVGLGAGARSAGAAVSTVRCRVGHCVGTSAPSLSTLTHAGGFRDSPFTGASTRGVGAAVLGQAAVVARGATSTGRARTTFRRVTGARVAASRVTGVEARRRWAAAVLVGFGRGALDRDSVTASGATAAGGRGPGDLGLAEGHSAGGLDVGAGALTTMLSGGTGREGRRTSSPERLHACEIATDLSSRDLSCDARPD
jgi:hypothetical protein